MQQGILICTGSHCLYKGVFVGSHDQIYNEYLRLKNKYSGFTVTYYEDDTITEFVNAIVDQPGLIQE